MKMAGFLLASYLLVSVDALAQQKATGWKLTISGVGNVLVNADNAPDGVEGTRSVVEIRRSFIDLRAENRLANGIVTGGKVRLWMEPVFYGSDRYNRPGFGTDDTRLPLELLNEVEAFIGNVPLDSQKIHLVSVTGGKGYIAFGFDRPEEQTTFEEFPLIHPLTKANGLGQEPHARLTYTNRTLGLTVDGEMFESTVHDSNLMEIDPPRGEGMSWAMRVRKTLPLQVEVMGSYADVRNTDRSTSDRLAVGVKKTHVIDAGRKLIATVENAGVVQHLLNGTDRTTTAWHAEVALLMKKDSVGVRYGRIGNPLRPAVVNELGVNGTRNVLTIRGGRHTMDVVWDYTRTSGATGPNPAGPPRTNHRFTGGLRFSSR